MNAQETKRTITARELRELLFMVKEGTTIEELRAALFDVEPHDKEFPLDQNTILKMVPQLYG